MTRTSSDQRRRQLTDAAIAILIEEGPHALTTRAVARRAGAPLGTVHYAFASKDELLAAAAGQILGSFAAALHQRVDETAGVRTALAVILRSYWDWIGGTPGLSIAVLETVVAGLRTSGTGQPIRAAEQVVTDALKRAAQHDAHVPRIPVEELARLTLIAADGLTLVHCTDVVSAQAAADLTRVTQMLQALV